MNTLISTQIMMNRYRQAVWQLAICLRACDKAVRPAAVWHKTVGLKGIGRRMDC